MTGLAGGKCIMSVHPKVRQMLAEPGVARKIGIQSPIDENAIQRLKTIPDFVRAYAPDAMKPDEFVSFGLTQRTLSQFIESGWAMLESFR